jgi:hypothetical protein
MRDLATRQKIIIELSLIGQISKLQLYITCVKLNANTPQVEISWEHSFNDGHKLVDFMLNIYLCRKIIWKIRDKYLIAKSYKGQIYIHEKFEILIEHFSSFKAVCVIESSIII